MKLTRRNLNRLIENYLKEEKATGSGGYEYEKKGTNIFITKNKGVPSNIKVAKGGKAYLSIAKDHFPELLPKEEKPATAKTGSTSGEEASKKPESETLQLDDIISSIPEGVEVKLAKNINKAVGPTLAMGMKDLMAGKNVDPGKKYTATFPGLKGHLEHCAQYVNKVTRSAGSAWIQGIDADKSGFDSRVFSASQIAAMEKAFNGIHKTGNVAKDSSPYYKQLQKLAVAGILPPGDAMKAKLGDIVGLIYYPSGYYPTAFFESASGYYMNGAKTGHGPFFVSEDGKPYTPNDDKNTKYKYDPSAGKFSFNTHVGFIGATIDGKPIVFHNIHGHVHLTPLKALYRREKATIGMAWFKSGPSAAEIAYDDMKIAAKSVLKSIMG